MSMCKCGKVMRGGEGGHVICAHARSCTDASPRGLSAHTNEHAVLMGDPTELRNAFYLFDGDVDGKLSEDEVV